MAKGRPILYTADLPQAGVEATRHVDECCGGFSMTRRQLLQSAASAALDLALPTTPLSECTSVQNGRGQVILIWLSGGASHVDTFDPKRTSGSCPISQFDSISSSLPGVSIVNQLPRLARQLDSVTLIRSLSHTSTDHVDASHRLLGRWFPLVRCEALGATALRRGEESSLQARKSKYKAPLSVLIDHAINECGGELVFPTGRTPALASIVLDGRYHDYGQVKGTVPARYGPSAFSAACYHAHTLIAAGAPRVCVIHRGWDTHYANSESLRNHLLLDLDQGLSGIIADVTHGGRLKNTLVICASEFGRSPHINPFGGRDHWPWAGSALLAGADLPPGRVIGATDPDGQYPLDVVVDPGIIGRLLDLNTSAPELLSEYVRL